MNRPTTRSTGLPRGSRPAPRATLAVLVVAVALAACGDGTDPVGSGRPGATTRATGSPPVRVAAAADLARAFEELGRRFGERSGHRVEFTFGSTGMLARQLREGAPFDVFAAANVSFVDEVIAAGACDGATKTPYARGRIAIVTRGPEMPLPTRLEALAEPRYARIAIANPEHAPYGKAAEEALTSVGAMERVRARLVLGENVRQTFQFVETGNVDAAIVALALVVDDRTHPWVLVDDALHRPIDQALAVCVHGAHRAGGAAFAQYVASAEGRATMRRFGFLLPGETLAGRAPDVAPTASPR